MPQRHATELSQAILDEKLDIIWGGYSRAELSYETLKMMKESGCRTLHVGYESPIQTNLDLICKGIDVSTMQEFADSIKKLNMWTSATFMIFPWLTEEQIRFTVKWAKSIKPKRMNIVQAQGYPNTPYCDLVKKFQQQNAQMMSFDEMKKWEQWGFKQFYVYNPSFWWEILKSPSGWSDDVRDARGMLSFLQK